MDTNYFKNAVSSRDNRLEMNANRMGRKSNTN